MGFSEHFSENLTNEEWLWIDTGTIKELQSSLDAALDNCAMYLTFIRMQGLLDEFTNFQDALEYLERTRKIFKEKV